jgi:UDP-N-acetylglucosamine 4,6-dehydratase (inverting)
MPWEGLTVLVTGGTGSFGWKFTEMVLRSRQVKKLIILSRDELKQHEMRQHYPDTNDSQIRYFIGDVRDKERLCRAFPGVDIVVHAAALKQVPACEYNPFEAVKTNIFGAQNVIEAAIDCGVKKVMAISTDKAVNPINLYGATKLCAEKMFVQANSYTGATSTKFSVCRYGNVVGSRGSVVPLFLKQRENGSITVTDSRMTRFWITLEQGAEFVIGCIERMHGGEIFVPKIPSMKIMDLAQTLATDCKIEYIGLRAGEKLHEVLVSSDEAHNTVELEEMYVVKPVNPWWEERNWDGARSLPEGFQYTSDTNARWLSNEELQRLVRG